MYKPERKPMTISHYQQLFNKHKEQILNDYFELLRFRSVSANPQYAPETIACSVWLQDFLKKVDFQVEEWPTPGYPVIFAEKKSSSAKAPTILLYHHYDVQPEDPLDAWDSPPFEPTVREGNVYARGAEDNKGQLAYTLALLKVIHAEGLKYDINLKILIEGEEEMGSGGLAKVLSQHADRVKADAVIIVDTGSWEHGTGSVTLGCRGIMTFDLRIQGPKGDLHSGTHGGIVVNPLIALCELLASLHDQEGRVTIPGFYDDIEKFDPQGLDLSFDSQHYRNNFGEPAGGEKKFSPRERGWLRPTLEINGIGGGYQGEGFKTVIPAEGHAKISCRLVPKQDPNKIAALVIHHLESHAPLGTKVKVTGKKGWGGAVRVPSTSRFVKAFQQANTELYDKPCTLILEGGSIGIAGQLQQVSGGDILFVGMGLPTDQCHAPNEHFGIDRLEGGFCMLGRALNIIEKL